MTHPFTGQITIPKAAQAVRGPPVDGGTFVFKRHPKNKGKFIIIGKDSGVSEDSGFVLEGSDQITMILTSLDKLWFRADRNGDRVMWVRTENSERIYASI